MFVNQAHCSGGCVSYLLHKPVVGIEHLWNLYPFPSD